MYMGSSHSCLVPEKVGVIGSPGTAVTDGCEPLRGQWEPKPNPLPEQQVFLNTESSFQAFHRASVLAPQCWDQK